jgi:hypothetical protein
MFFSQDWRERIKTENPDAGFGKAPSILIPVKPVLKQALQGRLESFSVQSGKNSTIVRRRFVTCCVCELGLTFMQPYIDQAARDKERAEEEKAAYDVRIRFPHLAAHLPYFYPF